MEREESQENPNLDVGGDGEWSEGEGRAQAGGGLGRAVREVGTCVNLLAWPGAERGTGGAGEGGAGEGGQELH
jgi:hypothetical protein